MGKLEKMQKKKKRKQELRKEITVAEKEFVGERSQRTVCLLQEKR